MTHKNRKKCRNFMFLCAGCSFLRAEGCLVVLHGGLVSRESGEEDQAHLLDRAPTQLALCLRLATI